MAQNTELDRAARYLARAARAEELQHEEGRKRRRRTPKAPPANPCKVTSQRIPSYLPSMSEYELQRVENMRRNDDVMVALFRDL